MAETTGNEIFGRPELSDIIKNQGQDNTTQVITRALLQASPLLQQLPFLPRAQVDAAAGQIAYSYKRRSVARVGQTRQYNRDYAPAFGGGETSHTATVKPYGDAIEYDRAFGSVGNEWLQRQIDAMMPGVQNRIADDFVNDATHGLSAVAAAEGRVKPGLRFSLNDAGNNLTARRMVNMLGDEIERMRDLGYNPVILANRDVAGAVNLTADVLGFSGRTLDFFGRRQVTTFNNAAMLNVGRTTYFGTPVPDARGRNEYPVLEDEIIPTVEVAEVAGPPVVPAHSVSDIYVVGFSSVNGVTAVTVDGQNDTTPVRFDTPANSPGAQRRREVEILIGLAVLDPNAIVKFEDVWLN